MAEISGPLTSGTTTKSLAAHLAPGTTTVLAETWRRATLCAPPGATHLFIAAILCAKGFRHRGSEYVVLVVADLSLVVGCVHIIERIWYVRLRILLCSDC